MQHRIVHRLAEGEHVVTRAGIVVDHRQRGTAVDATAVGVVPPVGAVEGAGRIGLVRLPRQCHGDAVDGGTGLSGAIGRPARGDQRQRGAGQQQADEHQAGPEGASLSAPQRRGHRGVGRVRVACGRCAARAQITMSAVRHRRTEPLTRMLTRRCPGRTSLMAPPAPVVDPPRGAGPGEAGWAQSVVCILTYRRHI